MIDVCRTCNICHLKEQAEERTPYFEEVSNPAAILIDDNFGYGSEYKDAYAEGITIMGKTSFTYTSTVRCQMDAVKPDELTKIMSRCAVWTHLLAEDRKLIVCTKNGLVQLGLTEEHPVGDVFADERLGVVVVIPPLDSQEFIVNRNELRIKVRRASREAGV